MEEFYSESGQLIAMKIGGFWILLNIQLIFGRVCVGEDFCNGFIKDYKESFREGVSIE